MKRFFNTAGPCQPDNHYTLDPLARLSSVRELVEQRKYFILHAPRQTGKTTTMLSFVEALNQEGKYVALYINVETAQPWRNNVAMANTTFVSALKSSALYYLPKAYQPSAACFEGLSEGEKFKECLQRWCLELSKPLVLFIDEADALIGDSLLSLLRQLRSGYAQRPKGFPHSVALIGLRDIRDYRIYSEIEKRYVIGGSAFNIKDESLTMSNFSHEDVRALYAQHTAETGQQFTDEAINMIVEQSGGQPWLVNALGRELCFNNHKVQPDGRTVNVEDVYHAGEILIQRRDTHLDHLGDKLTEPRVAGIIDIILSGESESKLADIAPDDLQYVIDLGLVVRQPGGLGIANPIYREVISRQLTLKKHPTSKMLGNAN
jgi:AAA domain